MFAIRKSHCEEFEIHIEGNRTSFCSGACAIADGSKGITAVAWGVMFVVLEILQVTCVDVVSPFGIVGVGGTAVSTYLKGSIPRT